MYQSTKNIEMTKFHFAVSSIVVFQHFLNFFIEFFSFVLRNTILHFFLSVVVFVLLQCLLLLYVNCVLEGDNRLSAHCTIA